MSNLKDQKINELRGIISDQNREISDLKRKIQELESELRRKETTPIYPDPLIPWKPVKPWKPINPYPPAYPPPAYWVERWDQNTPWVTFSITNEERAI